MSSRLNGLLERRGQLSDKMEALVEKATSENRDLTAEEKQAFEDFDAEFKRIEESIAFEKRVEERKAAAAKPVNVPGNDRKKTPAVARVRYSRLRAFKGENAEEDAYLSGMYLRAALMRDSKAAEWCRDNGVVIQKAQSESVNTAGGFLVPSQFEQAIIDLREEYGVFRMQCRLVPMGSDTMTIPRRAGGVTAYFVNENSAITESQKSWGQVQLSAKKMAALSLMSTELAEDAVISIADDLAQEMAYAFSQKEDDSGWNGDGTSTYGGITGVRPRIIDGTHTASAIDGAAGHDTFAEIDATDLANVMGALPKYAERNARWYVSQPGWAVVFQRLVQASGGTTMTELTGAKPQRSYLGYPVVIDQSLPTSTGDLSNVAMLFFGDLALACRMGERRGITVKTSEDRYFEYDQIGIQATERIDIVAHDLGSNTAAGPLIALIGE